LAKLVGDVWILKFLSLHQSADFDQGQSASATREKYWDPRQSTSANFVTEQGLHPSASAKNPADLDPRTDASEVRTSLKLVT